MESYTKEKEGFFEWVAETINKKRSTYVKRRSLKAEALYIGIESKGSWHCVTKWQSFDFDILLAPTIGQIESFQFAQFPNTLYTNKYLGLF